VKTAIRFKVACNVGDHLVARAQSAALGRENEVVHRRRPRDIGSDTVMDDFDALLERAWILVALPGGRTDAKVSGFQADQLYRVAYAQAALIVEAGGEFRVETHVRTARSVEEFKVEQQARAGEHILQKKRFTPGRVCADDVRNKALAAQGERQPGHRLTSANRRFAALQVVVRLRRSPLRRRIGDDLEAWMESACLPAQVLFFADGDLFFADGDDLVLRRIRQRRSEVLVLPGKILMDEKDAHGQARG